MDTDSSLKEYIWAQDYFASLGVKSQCVMGGVFVLGQKNNSKASRVGNMWPACVVYYVVCYDDKGMSVCDSM